MAYQQISQGSQGDEVKKWQQHLKDKGYNVTVDGNFGAETKAATMNYQLFNRLSPDGIVGDATWATYTEPAGATATGTGRTTGEGGLNLGNLVGVKSDAYNKANDALNAHPDFKYSRQEDYDKLLDDILARKDFTYDASADALYQQYKDMYMKQGEMASRDAMGQAAAMTGGYGNSYGATVANQAYQGAVGELGNVMPELYQMAYDKYNQEGQDMLNKAVLHGEERMHEYDKWADEYTKLANERDTQAQNDAVRDELLLKYGDNVGYMVGGGTGGTDGSNNGQYKTVNSENVQKFKEKAASESEYKNTAEGAKYDTYEEYIDAMISKWINAGYLEDENEVATLLAYYGLV